MYREEIPYLIDLYEPKSMKNFLPVTWKSAKNDIVVDASNTKYIDFTSTIFVQNFGHSNKRVKKYLKKQINSNLLHTYTYGHKSRAELLKALHQVTGYEKAFLLSSGTEATEAAVKLMRMYGKPSNRFKIVSFEGAMHGRTMAASIMKSNKEYDHPEFIRIPYPNESSSFEQDLGDPSEIAGVIIESYQGWSAKFMPVDYVKDLCEFCKKNSILVCLDEIQAGLYRCGTLFGFENYGIRPDIVCLGKALGGGLPLSAVLSSSAILDIPDIGDMSSTHSANPLCCSAGLAILEEIQNIDRKKLESNCKTFFLGLDTLKREFPQIITEIVCHGMVGSVIFKDKETASKISLKCMERGLLVVHTGRESIKFGPPITIKKANLLKGFKILNKAIYECS
jgi:acetylornithine/succinyldiaminopimelate/putrescine aminotransferase